MALIDYLQQAGIAMTPLPALRVGTDLARAIMGSNSGAPASQQASAATAPVQPPGARAQVMAGMRGAYANPPIEQTVQRELRPIQQPAQLQALPNPGITPGGMYGGGFVGAPTDAKAREYLQQRGMQNAAVQQRVGEFNRASDAVRARNLTERRGQVQDLIDQGTYGRGGQAELGRIGEELGGLAQTGETRRQADMTARGQELDAISRMQRQGPRQPGEGFKQLTTAQGRNVLEQGETLQSYLSLLNDFDDRYAGKGSSAFGEVLSTVGGKLPGLAEQFGGGEDFTGYWQRVAGSENRLRNQLFGATLTEGERKAWDKMTINPGQTAETVKRNLRARIAEMARDALNNANLLESENRDPTSIFDGLGMGREQLESLYSELSRPQNAGGQQAASGMSVADQVDLSAGTGLSMGQAQRAGIDANQGLLQRDLQAADDALRALESL